MYYEQVSGADPGFEKAGAWGFGIFLQIQAIFKHLAQTVCAHVYDAVLLSMGLRRSLQQHVLVTGFPNRHKKSIEYFVQLW